VEDVLERIATEFRGGFTLDRALVVRLRAEDRTVHAVVQQGVEWPGDDWLALDDFPFLTRALEAGSPVFVRDARREGAVPPEIAERFRVHSLVAVPLMLGGRCLGFLVGDRSGREFELADEELDVLGAVGMMAAVFIEKADQLADLQRALEELRGLDRAKSDFVSIASHELRTPIAVVHGIAATLHERGAELRDDQLHELRTALYEQTTRLGVLTDQLLDLSRLDSGTLLVRSERFSCRERVEAVLSRIAPDRCRTVVVGVDPTVVVETDPHAFERVVSNLLDNAFRYGEPPVEVRVDGSDAVRVVVQDRGEGVEPSFVPQLFDRFTRSPATLARRSEGAGLGLAIAASYAQAVGGSLSYEPADPSGARFTFELPA
jgi:signal transduction histidine kinase